METVLGPVVTPTMSENEVGAPSANWSWKLPSQSNVRLVPLRSVMKIEFGAAAGELGWTRMDRSAGVQFAPLSTLTSRNTSKKLLMRKPRGSDRMVCLPRDCLGGLSRIMNGPNGLVPLRLSVNISVSKKLMPPLSEEWVILACTPPLAWLGSQVCPPSTDTSIVTTVPLKP